MRRSLVWLLAVVLVAPASALLHRQIDGRRYQASYAYCEERAGLNRRIQSADMDWVPLEPTVQQFGRMTGCCMM